MSRIGRAPIEIPAGVTVKIEEVNKVTVKGPKGELFRELHPDMKITVEGNVLTVTRPSDDKEHRSLHGLTRTLLNNMVVGVTEGFKKTLEINGVGYRAAKQGKNLNLSLGFSHPVVVEPPAGITLDAPSATSIIVSGRKLSAPSRRRFAATVCLNRTRARASSTRASTFAARSARPAPRRRNKAA